ncbi:MAG: hypothetical protein ACKVTZ_14530 [Bacteroidia bacterium]
MAYSNFKSLKKTLKTFSLEEIDLSFFAEVPSVTPSEWLLKTLEVAKMFPLTNEKGKSERIISPILAEVAIPYIDKITLFSGEDLTIEGEKELSGECDFFFAKHPRKSVMQAPIITLVEAKDEDLEYGVAQCIAQMYGAKCYNEQEGKDIPFIYGCASTGGEWKFMRLEGNSIYLDTDSYYLNDLPKIIGIFHAMIQRFL